MPDFDIALAGNPNSGKTTLFNQLTGARQHVGNYPGVTVEKKEGSCSWAGNEINITDLPGTYSLTAYTEEEVVARDFLVNKKPGVINITDASNLERHLYLSLQIMEMGIPVIIALNMIDVAEQRGITVDSEKLSKRMNVPVVKIIARSGKGSDELLQEAVNMVNEPQSIYQNLSYGEDLDIALEEMEKIINNSSFLSGFYPSRWIALKYLEQDQEVRKKGEIDNEKIHAELREIVLRINEHLLSTLDTNTEAIIADYRYGYIKSLLQDDVISFSHEDDRLYISDQIDNVLTNRFLGPVFMFLILYGLYNFTFSYSEVPVGWLESFFNWLTVFVDSSMADGYLKSMLISGAVAGVGGVLSFVPIIAFMFFGIAILEDSGYLARVAYMMDRVLRIFGLHGSSVMSYIVSGGIAGGCAVPGVMAARTLRSKNERLATLLTTPFMNCGAKLPVFTLLIAAFFQEGKSQMLFILTLIAWLGALIVAKILRLTIIRGESTPFVMELPPYRVPTFRGLLIHTWERTWQYIKKAGTVILAISVLIWAMMTFPELPGEKKKEFELQIQEITTRYSKEVRGELSGAKKIKENMTLSPEALELENSIFEIENTRSESELKYSFAGKIGVALEKISCFAGFDWRTNIALVGGFAAKEVIVSSLGTAFSLGEVDAEDSGTLSDRLAENPGWNKVKAFSLILFIMFYSPCFVTIACIVKETGSWKYGFFSMVFNTIFAFILSVTVYQAGSFFS
jgi:ferrous iron transport protein B